MRGNIGQGNVLIPEPRDGKKQEEQPQGQCREASEPHRAAGTAQRQLGPRWVDAGQVEAAQGQRRPS